MNDAERIEWLEKEVERLSRQVRWFDYLLQRGSHRRPWSKMSHLEKARWYWYKARFDLEICRTLARWGRATARMAWPEMKEHEARMRRRYERLKREERDQH